LVQEPRQALVGNSTSFPAGSSNIQTLRSRWGNGPVVPALPHPLLRVAALVLYAFNKWGNGPVVPTLPHKEHAKGPLRSRLG
jgi:hypothetical protein